ncbi:MAG: amidase [Polyangiaceae bacterium]
MDEIVTKGAVELAALLRRREVSSDEVVGAFLARIAAKNPILSAFTTVFDEDARREARARDKVLAKRPGDLPPFFGVPTAVKDLNLVAGKRMQFGSRGAKVTWSPVDCRTTGRLRDAGFVFLGKLATSEYGIMPITEPDIHPPTANPWNLEHTAGGSSGGSGAALAADLVPIAQGSDGAGSVRIPSAFCHVFGLKPSRGRVRNAFMLPDETLLYTDGPLAHSVDDAAAMLDALAGITVGKPHWAPPPPRPFAELAKRPPGRLLVRFTTTNDLVATPPEIRAHVVRAAKVLADLGHDVEELTTTPGLSLEDFLPLWQKLAADVPLVRWKDTQPVTRWVAEGGARHSHAEVEGIRKELERRILAWLGETDIVLTPTVALPPPRLGLARSPDGPAEIFRRAAELGAYTAASNITGQPAASLPIGLTEQGLPIGLQIVGRRFADAEVLAIARVLEEALPYRKRRAPVAIA